jgi:hypothetical protein
LEEAFIFLLSSIHFWEGKYRRGKESRMVRGRWETLMDVGSTEVPHHSSERVDRDTRPL